MKASIQITRYARIHLLFLILFLLPTCGYSIQAPKGDTTYVLTIFHYKKKAKSEAEKTTHSWERKKRRSYIYRGATVDLKMVSGWEIKQAKIQSINKTYLLVNRQQLLISDIGEIRVGSEADRRGDRLKGIFLLVLGLLAGGWWFHINLVLKYGGMISFLIGILLPILVIKIAVDKLQKTGRRYNFHGPELRLRTLPLTSLPEKIQKKLARKRFIN